jgi:Flp pilus assembly protein TadG
MQRLFRNRLPSFSARRGAALLTVALVMPVLLGMCALAVDFGRIQVAKMQLENALDAASRYAATGCVDNTAVTKAIAAASQNNFGTSPLVLTSADVSVGKYDSATATFTVNGTPANAVRIRVTRASGRSVQMSLAQAIGLNSIAVSGDVFAYDANVGAASNPTGAVKGFVGINYFNVNGPLTIQAWDSQTGTTTNTATAWASAQTNGGSNLNNGVNIQGTLQTSSSVNMNGATISKGITGSPGNLSSLYPAPIVPGGATNMGNYNGPAGASQTFGPGTYFFNTFSVPSGKTVTFSGAANVYVSGSCNINGAVNTYQNLPSNLKIYNTGGGVDIGASVTPLYSDVYAPTCPLNLAGRTFYGSIIVSGVSVNSSSNMYIDARSSVAGFSSQAYTGASVKAIKPSTIN